MLFFQIIIMCVCENTDTDDCVRWLVSIKFLHLALLLSTALWTWTTVRSTYCNLHWFFIALKNFKFLIIHWCQIQLVPCSLENPVLCVLVTCIWVCLCICLSGFMYVCVHEQWGYLIIWTFILRHLKIFVICMNSCRTGKLHWGLPWKSWKKWW